MSARDGNDEIYSVDLTDGRLERLTSDPGTDWNPHVSPDGRTAIFYSERSGREALYALDLASGAVRPVAAPELPEWDGAAPAKRQ